MSIEERVYNEAIYFSQNYSTVREVAKVFKVGKSTVHNDLTAKLEKINYDLYLQVQKVIEYNKKVRHIRGGEATRKKYIKKKYDSTLLIGNFY